MRRRSKSHPCGNPPSGGRCNPFGHCVQLPMSRGTNCLTLALAPTEWYCNHNNDYMETRTMTKVHGNEDGDYTRMMMMMTTTVINLRWWLCDRYVCHCYLPLYFYCCWYYANNYSCPSFCYVLNRQHHNLMPPFSLEHFSYYTKYTIATNISHAPTVVPSRIHNIPSNLLISMVCATLLNPQHTIQSPPPSLLFYMNQDLIAHILIVQNYLLEYTLLPMPMMLAQVSAGKLSNIGSLVAST